MDVLSQGVEFQTFGLNHPFAAVGGAPAAEHAALVSPSCHVTALSPSIPRRLFDSFFDFGGETLALDGSSLRETPGFAVSLPWAERPVEYPHVRAVGVECQDLSTFLQATEGEVAEATDWIRRTGFAHFLPLLLRRLPVLPRAFGAWRDDKGEMEVAVSIIVPDENEAVLWQHALGQAAYYDLLLKRTKPDHRFRNADRA